MRSASTEERTDLILEMLRGSNCKAQLMLERWSGTEWQRVNDLDSGKGVNWSLKGKKTKYANFAFLPLAATMECSVLNVGGQYSPGSGTDYDNWFDLDTKVRIKAGYKLQEPSETSTLSGATLNSSASVYNYFTKFFDDTTDYIGLDYTASSGLPDVHFRDLFSASFGGSAYDGTVFAPAAYAVFTWDLDGDYFNLVNDFSVVTNNTKGRIFYRSVSDLTVAHAGMHDSTDWTFYGATTNGTVTVTVDDTVRRYFQVAVLIDDVNWDDDIRITSASINYQFYVEWIYYGVFYLDSPSYTDPGMDDMPVVRLSGRDAWKKIIETEINLPNISGMTLDDLIESICDQCGVSYTDDSIADLSAFGARTLTTGLGEPKKADEVLEWIMQILNKSGSNYRMYMEYDADTDDQILFVQPVTTEYVTEFVFNPHDFISIGDKKKNYDKLMKRMTLVNVAGTSDKEVTLDTDTFTVAGTWTLSWSGDAEFKRYTVHVNSGNADDFTITISSVNATSIVFDIASDTSFSVTITAYGSKWTVAPSYEGEYIHHDNMVANRGITVKAENMLLISDAEAAAITKGHIEKYGTPVNEANSLKHPYLNLMLEMNDPVMIYSLWTFVDDIYFITGINYHWDDNPNPADSSSYSLDDTGMNFSDISDFVYDEQEEYDIGFIYDMGIVRPTATDAEVDTASEPYLVLDVDEA